MKKALAAIPTLAALLSAAVTVAAENFYRIAPDVLTRPGGDTLRLDTLRGRPALINFWAPWCGPCREELPLLAEAHAQHGHKVGFLGIAVDDNLNTIGDFAKAYQIPYPVTGGRDTATGLLRELGNAQAGIPYTIALDAGGTVVFNKRGLLKRDELERLLVLLGEAAVGVR